MGWWFWETSSGPEPVYLGYSWLRPGSSSTPNPLGSESLDVWAVVVDSPFYKAGLTQGSGGLTPLRIESIDGQTLTNARELAEYLEDRAAGDQVTVAVSGATYLLTLENPPSADTEAVFRFAEEDDSGSNVLVQLVETVAEVPVKVIEATAEAAEKGLAAGGEAAAEALGAGSDVIDSYEGALSQATSGLLVVAAMAAGAYFIYDRERRR